jgi:hypothetical protein
LAFYIYYFILEILPVHHHDRFLHAFFYLFQQNFLTSSYIMVRRGGWIREEVEILLVVLPPLGNLQLSQMYQWFHHMQNFTRRLTLPPLSSYHQPLPQKHKHHISQHPKSFIIHHHNSTTFLCQWCHQSHGDNGLLLHHHHILSTLPTTTTPPSLRSIL